MYVCMCMCVCVCMCNHSLVRSLFPNHGVLVFQARTVTAIDLGSVASYKFNSIPAAPHKYLVIIVV